MIRIIESTNDKKSKFYDLSEEIALMVTDIYENTKDKFVLDLLKNVDKKINSTSDKIEYGWDSKSQEFTDKILGKYEDAIEHLGDEDTAIEVLEEIKSAISSCMKLSD